MSARLSFIVNLEVVSSARNKSCCGGGSYVGFRFDWCLKLGVYDLFEHCFAGLLLGLEIYYCSLKTKLNLLRAESLLRSLSFRIIEMLLMEFCSRPI
jgi:hypothetical protein